MAKTINIRIEWSDKTFGPHGEITHNPNISVTNNACNSEADSLMLHQLTTAVCGIVNPSSTCSSNKISNPSLSEYILLSKAISLLNDLAFDFKISDEDGTHDMLRKALFKGMLRSSFDCLNLPFPEATKVESDEQSTE